MQTQITSESIFNANRLLVVFLQCFWRRISRNSSAFFIGLCDIAISRYSDDIKIYRRCDIGNFVISRYCKCDIDTLLRHRYCDIDMRYLAMRYAIYRNAISRCLCDIEITSQCDFEKLISHSPAFTCLFLSSLEDKRSGPEKWKLFPSFSNLTEEFQGLKIFRMGLREKQNHSKIITASTARSNLPPIKSHSAYLSNN